jgi:diguanylate cyclase (GGDEF)-like protein
MKKWHFSLRLWIVSLVTLSMLLTITFSSVVGFQAIKEATFQNFLLENEAYALKLAHITDLVIRSASSSLNSTAQNISMHMDEKVLIQKELKRLFQGNSLFSSLIVTDPSGKVIRTYPYQGKDQFTQLQLPTEQKALKERVPLVSQPYKASNGKVVILISTPIRDDSNHFVGLLCGMINLGENNFFKDLLDEHFYQNGSYVFVVDNAGDIVYHPKPERLGNKVATNPVVQKIMDGKQGAEPVTNSKGVNFLAGYAQVPINGWGIICQTPTDTALIPSTKLIQDILYRVSPMFLLLLLVSWWFVNRIYRPVLDLSNYASHLLKGKLDSKKPRRPKMYKELQDLHYIIVEHLHAYIDDLYNKAQKDPLTGLANRRIMVNLIERYLIEGQPFAILLLDVDYFKAINDTFGHSKGDEVLKFLAREMESDFAKQYCCRFGGEEFLIIIPGVSMEQAYLRAEKFRERIANETCPTGAPLTVSIGLSSFPDMATSWKELLELADQALYRSKEQGRNRISS